MPEKISQMAPGRVMTAERDISISEAARLMQMMGIGSLILVDASKTPDAIVTDRDLVAKIGTGIDPRATPVGECASKPLITIRVDSDTVEAVALMKKHGIRRIPLVDEAGALTGMVTMDDVLVQLGTDGGEMLANLAEVIGAGARKEHPRSSAHDRSL